MGTGKSMVLNISFFMYIFNLVIGFYNEYILMFLFGVYVCFNAHLYTCIYTYESEYVNVVYSFFYIFKHVYVFFRLSHKYF